LVFAVALPLLAAMANSPGQTTFSLSESICVISGKVFDVGFVFDFCQEQWPKAALKQLLPGFFLGAKFSQKPAASG